MPRGNPFSTMRSSVVLNWEQLTEKLLGMDGPGGYEYSPVVLLRWEQLVEVLLVFDLEDDEHDFRGTALYGHRDSILAFYRKLEMEKATALALVKRDAKRSSNSTTPGELHGQQLFTAMHDIPELFLSSSSSRISGEAVQAWKRLVCEFIKHRKHAEGKHWHKRVEYGLRGAEKEPPVAVRVRVEQSHHAWLQGVLSYLDLERGLAHVRVKGEEQLVPMSDVKVNLDEHELTTEFSYHAHLILGSAGECKVCQKSKPSAARKQKKGKKKSK